MTCGVYAVSRLLEVSLEAIRSIGLERPIIGLEYRRIICYFQCSIRSALALHSKFIGHNIMLPGGETTVGYLSHSLENNTV